MRSRKVLTLAFFVLVLSVGYYSMSAAPVQSDEDTSYHGGTAWHTDFAKAQEIAADENKPILVYYWTTWCTYCEDYNEEVYSDPTVRQELDEFVLVAVNLDSDRPEAARLKQRYDANYPPQHVVITPEGEQVSKLPGYAPRDDFLTYLEEAQRRQDQ